jgi:secreted PhoX family phosphatase
MSEATESTMNRRKLLETAGIAAAAVATGLTKPVAAAEGNPPAAPAPIQFKWTVSGKFNTDMVIFEFNPPIATGRMLLKGTSEVLGGEMTMKDTHIAHFDVTGGLNRSTDGMTIFTGPGGDAIFVNWDGVGRPDPQTGELRGLAGFTIKGGRGRYAGATGSGTFDSTLNMATGEVTQVWQGTIVPLG